MTAAAILVAPVVVPMAAAMAALLLSGRALAALHVVAVAGNGLAAAAVVAGVLGAGPLRHPLGGWGAPLGVDLHADGVTAAMLALAAVVGTAGSVHARAWPGPLEPTGEVGRPLFWPVWYLLWAALNALFLSADVFNLYVTLELTTLAAVVLVAQTGERPVLVAGLRYLLAALFAALLYLLGVALVYGAAGTLDMALLAETLPSGTGASVGAALMAIGLLIKTALFPYHFWLPPAHSHAVAPVSAMLSGLVVKAGFYLQARLWLGPFADIGGAHFHTALGVLGAVAVLWGGLQALRADRLKLLVAYSTVGQVGYLFLAFPLMAAAPATAWTGAFFHALAHGTAKAAAFLAAGNVLYALKGDRIADIAGLGGRLRMSLLALALAGVSLAGLPPSGGFVAKWLLMQAAIAGGGWGWVAAMIAGGLLATAYIARVLNVAMTRPEAGEVAFRAVPRPLEWTALALAVAAVALGAFAAWPIDLIAAGAPPGLLRPPTALGEGAWLPILILLSSFLPGIVVFFLGEERARARTALNLFGAVAKVSLVVLLLAGVYLGRSYEARLALLPGLDLLLRADPLSLQFVLLSAGLWLVTTVYAIGYLEGSPDRARFFGFFNLSVTASTGIALSGNLITFLFFYEFLTLATYPLVVHRGTAKALRAGRVYLAYTVAGGASIFLGAAWLHALGGNLDFSAANSLAWLHRESPAALACVFALLIGGLGVKAALVPLHGWLPIAMVAPAPVSALLHAVAVVKAGAFGIVRVLYDVFGLGFSHAYAGTGLLAAVAAVTIVHGSVRALGQDELKRRLAYSTVSQLAYIALGAALAGPLATIGALVHLVHQGVMKITLFLCAGNLAESYGIHKVADVAGMGRRMPLTMTAFTVAALGMIGFPPLAGFVSKWYLAGGGLHAGAWWVVPVLVASSALNAAYFLPIVHAAWFKPPREDFPELRDGGWWLTAPPLVTAALSLGAGLLAGLEFSPLGWASVIAERAYYGVAPQP